MQIATIAPIYNLELCDSFSHLYLVLQFLCAEDPQYKSYFTNIKKKYGDAYVILDNNANEGCLCEDTALLSTAKEINADEIVCPDVYEDADNTIKITQRFLDTYHYKYIENNFNTMAVLQGKDKKSFLKCYNEFVEDPRVNFLGVGYRNLMKPFRDEIDSVKWPMDTKYLKEKLNEDCYYYTLSRLYFLKYILDFEQLKMYNKSLHLLGSYNPFEMKFYNEELFTKEQLKFIRGWDSACCTQAAQAGVVFDNTYGVVDKPKAILGFDKHIDSATKQMVELNIQTIKEWIGY
jgi:hypothetical protein